MKGNSMQVLSERMDQRRNHAKQNRQDFERQELRKLGKELRQLWQSELGSTRKDMVQLLRELRNRANPRSMGNRFLIGSLAIMAVGVLGNLGWNWWLVHHQSQPSIIRAMVLKEIGLEMVDIGEKDYLLQDWGLRKPEIFSGGERFPDQWLIRIGE